jgi:hypothetical protein
MLGELVIEDDLVIGSDGNPLPLTLDGSGMSRLVSVSTLNAVGSRVVSIYDLTFQNGTAVDGGALYIGEGEEVACGRCLFDANTATGDAPGMGEPVLKCNSCAWRVHTLAVRT